MPNRSFETPKPGGRAISRELAKLAQAVRAHDRVYLTSGRSTRSTSGLGLGQFMGLSGQAPTNNDYAPFWAKITGHAGPTTTTVRPNGITSSAADVTLPVLTAAGFPSSGQYPIKVDSEYMLVTAGQGTTSWTVTRAIWGTTIAAHAAGATVSWSPMRYSFTEQQQDAEGVFSDKGEPRQGTSTSSPAFEVNDNEEVETDTIVQMWLGDTSDYYLFEHCCDNVFDDELVVPRERPDPLREGSIWVENCTFHWYCSGQVKAAASTFVTDDLEQQITNLNDWLSMLIRWAVGNGADDLPPAAVDAAFEDALARTPYDGSDG